MKAVAQTTDRLPPHSIEAEQGVLGCCLLDPKESLPDALLALPDPAAFYDLRHAHIFGTLMAMESQRVPIDIITLQERLRAAQMLDSVGGLAYLSTLPDFTPSAANLPQYLAIVKEKWLARRFIAMCGEVSARLFEANTNVEQVVAEVSTDLFKLCETGQASRERHVRDIIVDVQLDVLDKFQRGVKRKIGPQTGFNYLDNILPGFAAGQLIVEAARPRTGKSAKLMQTAEHIAGEGVPVGVFSLEMTSSALMTRAVFQRGGADLTKFYNGFMESDDLQKLVASTVAISKLPLYIDESPRLSIEDLEIRARRMKRQHNIGILFIDYFQLLYVRNRHKQWSKSDELAECSMRLKALARELKIPVYIAAQMNREIEKETHRRPRLSDLRDTGQLEQDADVIMFLWKPDLSSDAAKKRVAQILPRIPCPEHWRMVKANAEGIQTDSSWQKNLSMIVCTVEKQREGRSGEDASLVFIKPWTRFVDAYRSEAAAAKEQLNLGEEPHET